MNKKRVVVIVGIILIIIIAVAGYLFFVRPGTLSQTADIKVLPPLYVETNPMKNTPDVNPVDKSNPFRSIKTNPFQ